MEGPEHRRVRRHRPEEVLLERAGARCRRSSRRRRRASAPIWTSTLPRSCSGIRSPRRRDARRERITEPQPVGKGPKSVQSDVGHHPVTAGFHNQATRAVTVHFVSALLVGDPVCLDNLSFP